MIGSEKLGPLMASTMDGIDDDYPDGGEIRNCMIVIEMSWPPDDDNPGGFSQVRVRDLSGYTSDRVGLLRLATLNEERESKT